MSEAAARVERRGNVALIADEEPKWERTTREFTELLKSDDAEEGPLAFAEKRQPVWKAR